MRILKRPSKYLPIHLVHVYRLTRAGLGDAELCKALGLKSRNTLLKWRRALPELREAEEMGAKELARDGQSLADWVYERLSPELKALYQELTAMHERDLGPEAVEALFLDHGKVARQRLFLHALCVTNFSPSRAMQVVGIGKGDFDKWCAEPGFLALVKEIAWHRANFFEEALVKLVKLGHPGAVLFANRTANSDRGYGKLGVLTHEHSGQVGVGPALDLQDLAPYLSESAKAELVVALRRHGAATAGPDKPSREELMYRQVAGGLPDATVVSGPGLTG